MTRETDFQLWAVLPPEISHRILTQFSSGKDLSTLALAVMGSPQECNREQSIFGKITQVGLERILGLADFMEDKSKHANENGQVDTLVAKATAWIRSVAKHPNSSSTSSAKNSPAKQMRYFSENMALLDFLQQSIRLYSRPALGQFEWPLWIGQVCIEGSRGGTRLRNTARVVLTAPVQRPSFISGSELLKNQTPSSVFRGELYNMIPVPPWGCLRPLSKDDRYVLRPVWERLELQNHVAVPSGFHHTADVLDVRIITSRQAERLLSSRSWRPKTDWILKSDRLIFCWQDDSAELENDREYLPYIIGLMKAQKRLRSAEACCREYRP